MTYSGATLATTLLTQLFKELSFIKKIPTRIFSYAVSLVVMLLAMLFEGTLNIKTASIALINSVVVALAANGAFDAVSSTPQKPKTDGQTEE